MSSQTLATYRIGERLGAGGMGVVHQAEDTTLRRSVAVKFFTHAGGIDDSMRRRFLREARTAAGLNHPNIARRLRLNY